MLKIPLVRFSFLPFVLVVVLSLVLSSCSPQGTPIGNNPGQTGSGPQKGGTWIVAMFNEPDALIPNTSVQTFSVLVDQAIYAPLFYGDAEGRLHPGIATEMPTTANGGVSADLKTWTFKLRPGLKWSDGQPLTAEDVDFTWRLWTNPQFAAVNLVAFRLIQDAIISSDKLSITFTLKQAYAPFVTAWADAGRAPVPKHHYEKMDPSSIKKTEGLKPQVSSGPFTLKESKPGERYVVERNAHYYRASEGLPYLDSIVFRPIPNQDTILQDLQAGTIDSASFLDVTKMSAYRALQDYEIVQSPSPYYEGIHFNFRHPVLRDNLAVRKAMTLAVDRETLVKSARGGLAEALCTDHTRVFKPGFQENIVCPKFDLNEANKILDEAGWVKGSDGIRVKDGNRLEFNYATTANNRWREKDQLINQENFSKIGIKVNIVNYPANTFFGPFLNEGDPAKYQIAEWASNYDYDADNAKSFSCNQFPPKGENVNFYCNQQLEPLFVQAVGTDDPGKRQQVYNQIHQIMLDDAAFISMFALVDLFIHKKGTNNYKPGPFGPGETSNVWEWWCSGGKCP
jgi:peptide/nickel transport system substrate-binding protein